MGRKYATKRTKWWTLVWPNGALDIDFDNCLHLSPTRTEAISVARQFDPEPLVAKIELRVGKPKRTS